MTANSRYPSSLPIVLIIWGSMHVASEGIYLGPCLDSSCALTFNNDPPFCYCDPSCLLYGDCCHDASVPTMNSSTDMRFSCINSGLDTYWMIASCSRSWITEQLADGVANVNEIVSLCEDPTATRASYRIVPPPVTDGSTGLVYRNEFCARCNGLQLQSNGIRWRIQLTCENSTTLSSETVLTFNELFQFCSVNFYLPPTSLSSPRECKPLPQGVISTCPQDASMDLRENCGTFGLNLVTSNFGGSVYFNVYCAACWNVTIITLDSCLFDLVKPTLPMELGNIAILWDISGTGRTASSSTTTYSLVEEVCPSGSVYDTFRGSCRTLPSANCTNSTVITLVGGSYSLISNESVFWKSYNLNVSIESVNDNGRPLVCIPSVQSTNCVPIILESSEYIQQGNDSSTFNLLWLSDNETYFIEGTDINGRPLICTNLTQNVTRNSTRIETVFSYPIAFDILSYIGISIDFVSCLLFLLTFFLFKDLRTFFSKLMVNFILSILLGDLIFLFGAPFFAFFNSPDLCITVGIVLHYVYLCRFSWMSVMGSELIRSFYNIKKLNKSTAENWKLLTLYMLLAWLSPLVIVIPTIIVNFTVEDSVNYGVGSSCWINQPIALIVTFVVPVGLSVIFNVIAFIVVMAMIGCIKRRPMVSSIDPKEHRKQSWKNFRFAVALLTVTGLSWLFGFLALFSSDLSWAWYLFIIFNTTQAVTILVAFLFTKKVFHLYWSLLCCLRMNPFKNISSKKPSTTSAN